MDIKLNTAGLEFIQKAVEIAAIKTAEALKGEIINEQVMPNDNGNLQGGGTYANGVSVKGNEVLNLSDGNEVHVVLANSAPQARRLYFHPEYDFQKINNPNARGKWLQPWIDGEHKDFVQETFIRIYKKETGL